VQGLLSQVQAVPMSLPRATSQSGSWSKVNSEWYDGTCIILCLPFFVLWVNSRFLNLAAPTANVMLCGASHALNPYTCILVLFVGRVHAFCFCKKVSGREKAQ